MPFDATKPVNEVEASNGTFVRVGDFAYVSNSLFIAKVDKVYFQKTTKTEAVTDKENSGTLPSPQPPLPSESSSSNSTTTIVALPPSPPSDEETVEEKTTSTPATSSEDNKTKEKDKGEDGESGTWMFTGKWAYRAQDFPAEDLREMLGGRDPTEREVFLSSDTCTNSVAHIVGGCVVRPSIGGAARGRGWPDHFYYRGVINADGSYTELRLDNADSLLRPFYGPNFDMATISLARDPNAPPTPRKSRGGRIARGASRRGRGRGTRRGSLFRRGEESTNNSDGDDDDDVLSDDDDNEGKTTTATPIITTTTANKAKSDEGVEEEEQEENEENESGIDDDDDDDEDASLNESESESENESENNTRNRKGGANKRTSQVMTRSQRRALRDKEGKLSPPLPPEKKVKEAEDSNEEEDNNTDDNGGDNNNSIEESNLSPDATEDEPKEQKRNNMKRENKKNNNNNNNNNKTSEKRGRRKETPNEREMRTAHSRELTERRKQIEFRWIGYGQEYSPTLTVYQSGFARYNTIYHTGDHVFFTRKEGSDAPRDIGRIALLYDINATGRHMARLELFVSRKEQLTPSAAPGGQASKLETVFAKGEVFPTTTVVQVPISQIITKCRVAQAAEVGNVGTWSSKPDHFWWRKWYDTKKKEFLESDPE